MQKVSLCKRSIHAKGHPKGDYHYPKSWPLNNPNKRIRIHLKIGNLMQKVSSCKRLVYTKVNVKSHQCKRSLCKRSCIIYNIPSCKSSFNTILTTQTWQTKHVMHYEVKFELDWGQYHTHTCAYLEERECVCAMANDQCTNQHILCRVGRWSNAAYTGYNTLEKIAPCHSNSPDCSKCKSEELNGRVLKGKSWVVGGGEMFLLEQIFGTRA